jgi:Ca2+-binding RTX toxin-like protein
MATSIKNSAGGLDITATLSTETLIGTSFNDTYIINSLSNKFLESLYGANGGIDTIKTGVLNGLKTYALEPWGSIENLTYTGTLAATLKGNSLSNVIKANASAMVADTLYGDKGDDTLFGYGGADNLQGGDGNDTLYAGVDADVDVLIGGTGNDTYRDVTNEDTVLETARGGFDTIVTNEKGGRYLDLRNFTNIEGLSYISKVAATLHGNNAANVINATGSTGAVSLFGYDGNDTLIGGTAADRLEGGNGDDNLNGGAGVDTMIGGKGNDIYHSDSTDVITELANEGTDTIVGAKTNISYAVYAAIENLVYTGIGNVSLTGNGLSNVVVGGAGNNTILGGAGHDVVVGGNGSDNVQGNTGDDILYGGSVVGIENTTALRDTFIRNFARAADGAADTLAGGDGSDIYIIDEMGDAISEISTDTGTDVVLSTVDFSMKGALNVEALVLDDNYSGTSAWYAEGSDQADLIIGNSSENYIAGGLGNDILTGDFTNYTQPNYWYPQANVTDVVDGGDGDDILLAMAGPATDSMLLGGAGNDFYMVMNGNAEISDTAGSADVLYLTTSDTGDTKDGIERIVLAGGNATYDQKALDALNKVRAVAGMVDSERVSSMSAGGSSPYTKLDAVPASAALNATGNALSNTMYGNGYDNSLSGGAGNDTLYGGAGNDTLAGDAGADRLVGGLGDDVYVVDASDTVVEAAGEGIDMIRSATLTSYSAYANIEGLEYTGTASVTLQNGTANTTIDRLYGGSGSDTINGFGGDDTLRGNAGNDKVNGGDGADTVFGGLGADILSGGTGNDKLYGNELPSMYSYPPTTPPADLGNTIHGDAGSDTIYGGSAADKLYGDADNDFIYGGLGADVIEGGDGNDQLYAGDQYTMTADTSANTLNGGAGNDSLSGAAGADTLSGGDGNDSMSGDGGNDTLNGGDGADTMYGDSGNDTLNGGAGGDYIYGGDGNDTILADADGSDRIQGGAGDDILYGGTIVPGAWGLTGQDIMYGDDGSTWTPSGNDKFRFSEPSLSNVGSFGDFQAGHKIIDFGQGADRIELARALVGDGDLAIEGGLVKTTAGGTFSSAAEMVIVRANVLDSFDSSTWAGSSSSITASAVIDTLGTADKAFAIGAERLFVVDDGYNSAVFKFTSMDAGSTITADELQLVVTVVGQQNLALNDFGLY